jgi:hypothetical protein
MGKKQAKPPAPQLLFHEILGRDLTDKFTQITHQTARRSSLSTYFATGLVDLEYDFHSDIKGAVVATTELQPTSNDAVAAPSTAILHPEAKPFPQTANVLESQEHATATTTSKSYSLSDLNAFQAIEQLISRYGRMAHMGVRDHNYSFFLTKSRNGLLSYRLIDHKVAVISGDPMCPVSDYMVVLEEFSDHCKANHWQWAMQGGSKQMAQHAHEREWTTVHYGRERALNVQTNPVLLGSEGKRIRTTCKSLQKSVTVDVYCPAYTRNHGLEHQIVAMYDAWRGGRNTSRTVQAYITVFDLLTLHRLMIFVYAHDDKGELLGFAALRRLREGYHIDPITVAPEGPKGLTDLLLISAMALLRESNVTRLVLGVEPLDDLGEIHGMSWPLERLTRKSHRIVSAEIHQGGKRAFNDRFRPDEAFEEPLFMVYPNSPGIKQSVAMAHFANIRLHEAVKQRIEKEREKRRRNSDPEVKPSMDGNSNGKSSTETMRPSFEHAKTANVPVITRHIDEGSKAKDGSAPTGSLLAPPALPRERARSLSRLFKRSSDPDVTAPFESGLSYEQEQTAHRSSAESLAAPPAARARNHSRIRLFRHHKIDADPDTLPTVAHGKIPDSIRGRVPAQATQTEAGLLSHG